MAKVCLMPNKIEDFKKALKTRAIKIEDLINMSSEKRIKLLEEYAGKNASDVNLLFERKLVLKNQMLGLKNLFSKLTKSGKHTPEQLAEMRRLAEEFRLKQQDRIFNPKEQEAFLESLAEQRLGVAITRDEAQTLFKLQTKTENLLGKFDINTEKWVSEEARLDYGASKVISEDYVKELMGDNRTVAQMLKERGYEFKKTFGINKPRAILDLLKDTVGEISKNSIALVASVDNSFLGRQGLKTLMTHPSIWWKDMAKQAFIDFARTFKKGKLTPGKVLDATWADIYSRPNYINGNYHTARLIPKFEEQFPTSLPERIPLLGRIFKASENAFVGSGLRGRTKLFDFISDIAKNNNVVMDKVEVQSIGKMINSLTARGELGRLEGDATIRLLLWAPKMIKANWDILTAHMLGAGLKTKFARQQAFKNTAKILTETAIILGIAKAINSDAVEFDPRSSRFGKIGNIDITGGMAGIVTLASRLASNISISSTTGIKTNLGAGFAERSRFDVMMSFLTNKTTPLSHAVISKLQGRTFEGKEANFRNLIPGLITPITIQNAIELKDDASVEALTGVMLDFIGLNYSNYKFTENWEMKDTQEMSEFKSQVGSKRFTQANEDYNKMVDRLVKEEVEKSEYKSLSDDDKQKRIQEIKKDSKKKVFEKYE